jgi:hypothetical protein
MNTIRTATLTALTVIVLAIAVYFAAPPRIVATAYTGPATCPVVHASWLSTQELKNLLNSRYERRVGLPR